MMSCKPSVTLGLTRKQPGSSLNSMKKLRSLFRLVVECQRLHKWEMSLDKEQQEGL